MDVRRLGAHRLQQHALVLARRQIIELYARAMRTEAADEPTLLDRNERISRADRGFEHRRVIDLRAAARPVIGRRQHRLGLARHETAIAFDDADIALTAEAAETGDAMDEARRGPILRQVPGDQRARL